MKFDIMGIVFMAIAILVGNVAGPLLGGFFGVKGFLGAFLVGAVVYIIYSVLTGAKMTLWIGLIFSISVYASSIITSWIASQFSMVQGIIAMFVQAIILSAIVGYVGGAKTKAPVQVKGK